MTKALAKNASFHLMILAAFTFSIVNGLPLAFGPDFGLYAGFSPRTCSIILAVVNAVGSPARVVFGLVGDKYGRQNVQVGTLAATTILVWAIWLSCAAQRLKVLWWLFNLCYGALSSGWSTALNPVMIDVFGSEVFFGASAWVSISRGLGTIIGGPLGGAVLGKSNASLEESKDQFIRLVVFTGAVLLIATGAGLMIRILHARAVGWRKWS
jgi:MFS family permease